MNVSEVTNPRAAVMRWLKHAPAELDAVYCSLSVPLATALIPVVRLRTKTASECMVSVMLLAVIRPLSLVVVVRMKDWSTVAGSINLRVAGLPDASSAPGIWKRLLMDLGYESATVTVLVSLGLVVVVVVVIVSVPLRFSTKLIRSRTWLLVNVKDWLMLVVTRPWDVST